MKDQEASPGRWRDAWASFSAGEKEWDSAQLTLAWLEWWCLICGVIPDAIGQLWGNLISAELLWFDTSDLLEFYGQTTLLAGVEFFLKGVDIPIVSNCGKTGLSGLGMSSWPGREHRETAVGWTGAQLEQSVPWKSWKWSNLEFTFKDTYTAIFFSYPR